MKFSSFYRNKMKILLLLICTILAYTFAAPSSRLTGGQDANRNEFPYQVSVQRGFVGSYQHYCGGTIINENWVVTAAHCITRTSLFVTYRIRAGVLNLRENVASLQTVNVQSITVHENFQSGISPNDIALLKLRSPLTWTEAVQPISLPEANTVPQGEAILSGWGSISTTNIAIMPETLQTVTIPIIGLEQCANALTDVLGSSEPLDSNMMCTGPLTGGISACSGDSGGPLVQNGQLIGIVSWGVSPCGFPGAPSVYAKTSSYINWISNKIN